MHPHSLFDTKSMITTSIQLADTL